MQMVSPQEWGARVNYDAWADTPYIKDDIAIHWGGTKQPTWKDGVEAEKKILQAWERYHIDGRGWRGIAYGFAIGASGTVYRLRGKNNYGAHRGDKDGDGISNNKEIVPIVFIMGEDSGPPTEAMWKSMSELYWWLLEQPWTDGIMSVWGHRELGSDSTQCPGDDIIAGRDAGKATQRPSDGSEEPDPRYVLRVQYDEYLRDAHAQFQINIAKIKRLEEQVNTLERRVADLQMFEQEIRDL
ncbi:peptidoglycan recognition protein family protein [Porticoccus sp.]